MLRRGRLRKTQHVVHALRGISLTVGQGELIGLVGPNGAGKTTTIRILATLLLPDSGAVHVLGHDVAREAREVRRRVGFLFGGERGLYGRVSAWANLRYFANLYGLSASYSSPRIDDLLALVGLSDRAHDKVDTYSRGMKQRLHVARALLHDPEVLYVDEPTIGLDPVSAREVRKLIQGLSDAGRTILLTTHYMLEADELCDRVAVINHGRIIACDRPSNLRRLASDLRVVEVEVAGLLGEELTALDRLHDGTAVIGSEPRDGGVVVQLQSARGREVVSELERVVGAERIRSTLVREPTLEDVYVRLIGESDDREDDR